MKISPCMCPKIPPPHLHRGGDDMSGDRQGRSGRGKHRMVGMTMVIVGGGGVVLLQVFFVCEME